MITFSIDVTSTVSPDEILEGIFDVDKWTSFAGYGPLPGIRKVIKESPMNAPLGTVFYVENTDGSQHRETVMDIDPSRSITMKIDDFAPPLSSLATHFVERWDFCDFDTSHRIIRTFELHSTTRFSTIPLWAISHLLRKAVKRHTDYVTKQH
jgi:hypothetical protein